MVKANVDEAVASSNAASVADILGTMVKIGGRGGAARRQEVRKI